MEGIIYSKLSYRITGLCLQTYKDLGRFRKERQYGDILEKYLQNDAELKFKREYEIALASEPKGNIVDFIIKGLDGIIVLDLKAKKLITKEDYFQMQRYLQSGNARLGMIVNFRNTFLEPKRIINHSYKPKE